MRKFFVRVELGSGNLGQESSGATGNIGINFSIPLAMEGSALSQGSQEMD